MLKGFTKHTISVGKGATINLAMAGEGHPVVLLHGFPETKMAWREVAPMLIGDFKVIVPDLPGYGDSTGPSPDSKHDNYSKRGLGNLLIEAIRQLGIEQFSLVGHDRGARVAYRMALDHPELITMLVLMGIIPTIEVMEKLNYRTVLSMENWFFLSQPRPFPETMINAMPDFYLNHILDSWSKDPKRISREARIEYLRCFRDPQVIEAICEEYRASEMDVEHDRNDRMNGKRIACPTLVLWSDEGFTNSFGDILAIWKHWSDDVRGLALPCGHFLMEEAPDQVSAEIKKFFRG
jgi:haloacetate dehalogenase